LEQESTGLRCFVPGSWVLSLPNGNDLGKWREPAAARDRCDRFVLRRDLVINVNWENLSAGNHTQMLEVLQPGGGLYQASQSSFLVDGASQSSLTMTRTLPVAGAWISQRRMTGEWSVRVSLDGKAITSQTVQINP
jgi:hypothetical protein